MLSLKSWPAMGPRWLVLVGFGFVLGGALLAWPIVRGRSHRSAVEQPALPTDVLWTPIGTAGSCVPLPLSVTEQATESVAETLAFSDYRYVRYADASGVAFDVYLAYWKPRQAHFLEVGTHAPDNCWVTNGMTLELREASIALPLEGARSWPGNHRRFRSGGESVEVVYWHLLAGKPLNYDRYGTGKTLGYLWDNRSAFFARDGAQYFLRISSTHGFDRLQHSSLFLAVMEQLGRELPLAAQES